MQEETSWRDLLGRIVADPQERQRIALSMGINPVTLQRWVANESHPRIQSLHELLAALPDQRAILLPLIEKDVRGFRRFDDTSTEGPELIPSEFYMRVCRSRAITPQGIGFSALSDLILQQALDHFDPQRLGIGISIARCLLSNTDAISSLLADIGRGSPPWESTMEHERMLLGAESLAGYAASTGQLVTIADLYEQEILLPSSVGTWEKSAVAVPIVFEGKIGGSLLISSTQQAHFSPARCRLAEDYADLLAIAMQPEQFVEPSRIRLRILPSQEEQRPFLMQFRTRVHHICQTQAIPISAAELQAWQQIEHELIQFQVAQQTHAPH